MASALLCWFNVIFVFAPDSIITSSPVPSSLCGRDQANVSWHFCFTDKDADVPLLGVTTREVHVTGRAGSPGQAGYIWEVFTSLQCFQYKVLTCPRASSLVLSIRRSKVLFEMVLTVKLRLMCSLHLSANILKSMSWYCWPANHGHHSTGIYVTNSFIKIRITLVFSMFIGVPWKDQHASVFKYFVTLLYLVCTMQSKENSWFRLGMDHLFKWKWHRRRYIKLLIHTILVSKINSVSAWISFACICSH